LLLGTGYHLENWSDVELLFGSTASLAMQRDL